MKRKICIAIIVFSLITLLTGIADLAEGIRARGASGVNYGRVLFPLLLGAGATAVYRKDSKKE